MKQFAFKCLSDKFEINPDELIIELVKLNALCPIVSVHAQQPAPIHTTIRLFTCQIAFGEAPSLAGTARSAYLEAVLSYVFLRGCKDIYLRSLPDLQSHTPALVKSLRVPNLDTLFGMEFDIATEYKILKFCIREQRDFDAGTRQQLLAVLETYYTFHYESKALQLDFWLEQHESEMEAAEDMKER
ncbi:hypothetical protein ENBRE01_3358 [Enteropsectra breve]|nr:hypothetical protein ENBRE01_3358 [Enteropsectra breve]